VQPSAALITGRPRTGCHRPFQALPERGVQDVARDPFYLFPRNLGDWQQDGPREILAANIVDGLARTTTIRSSWRARRMNRRSGFSWRGTPIRARAAFTQPEICLPGAGWEIAWLERSDIADRMGTDTPFNINRAIIQQNDTRMMVYYWFQQGERRIAWDFAAKFYLLIDGDHERLDRWRPGPADDADRTGRGGCGGGGTAAKRAGRADADPPALRARQLRHVAYAFQPRDILGEGGLNLLAEIGAIPASSLVAGQDRYFIAASHQLGAQAALPGLRPVSTHQARHSASSA
jgi:EpsI family protein